MKNTITLPASINVAYNKCSNCYQYRLIIYNSKFSKLLHNIKQRARLVKRDDEFYLIKDSSGNLLTPRPKSQNLFMSIKKMLSKEEFPTSKNTKTVRIKLKLNPDEWGLVSLDRFLESKEERDLAENLMLKGYNVSPITYNDADKLNKGCADLAIQFDDRESLIEITTTSPSSKDKGGINSPHGHQWVKVSGRIFPLLLYCVENKQICFFVMNERWKKYKHVNYFTNKLKNCGCFLFFSDFSNNWSIEIVDKIHRILSK